MHDGETSQARAFLAARGQDADASAVARLEAALADAHARALALCPEVKLGAQVFAAYLGARCRPGLEAEAALASLCAEDLFLACACAAADPAALRHFDARLGAMVTRVGARMKQPPWLLDEVKQLVRTRLLTAEPGAVPRIAEYSGQGALAAWLRVVVVRAVLSFMRTQKHDEETLDDVRMLAELPCSDPELALLRQRHAADVESAFRAALAALTPREGAVLRLYVLERMLPAQIAQPYGVDRSTVVRWLQAIYAKLLAETRASLQARLRLSESGLGSLLRAMYSHLHDEVAALLRAGPIG